VRRSTLFACALAVAVLSGCGMGKNQNPVASDEELGRTRAEEEAKPGNYVTKAGDSLRSIAARPEIYGDAELWTLLMDANPELGVVSARKKLASGLSLKVPRSLSVEALEMARERARQMAASSKMKTPAKKPEPEAAPVKAAHVSKPAKPAAPIKPGKPAAAPAAKAPAAEPAKAQAAQPVPRAKSGGMLPILFLLLLVLAAIGAVLYVFSRRDKQDQA
jgi:nucleoid-associated protein YgaU